MSNKLEYKDLLNAGVHFGHLTRKWDPRMAPYIFMERNGIHIIDLNKTLRALEEAQNAVRNIVKRDRNNNIMFVATKKQAKELVATEAARNNMPYVTDRWLGGMLTNFQTVRKSLKKLSDIDKMSKDDTWKNLNKKERLMLMREREKLARVLGGLTEMKATPAALFIVDVKKEHIAVSEAKKLGIPVIGMVDTNSNPLDIDFPIPANDDAFKSIAIITQAIGAAVEEGLLERKRDKHEDAGAAEHVEVRASEVAAAEAAAAPAAAAEEVAVEAPTEAPAASEEENKDAAE